MVAVNADQAGPVPLVGIWPARAAADRPTLLAALAHLSRVRFVPLQYDEACEGGISGLIVFRSPETTDDHLPRAHVPTLVLGGADEPHQCGSISFTSSPHVDFRLRERSLAGEWSPRGLAQLAGCEVLAIGAKAPVWGRLRCQHSIEIVSLDFPELGPAECLRDRLRPGNCLGLIALLQFLRRVAPSGWIATRPHAAFLVDDPNVHWRTYGYIDFAQVAAHASRWNYHISFATIPLDMAVFDWRTVKLFQSARKSVSLTIHGNNHTAHELASPASPANARALLAQAVRRTAKFETRTGLDVSRVMVPPHESCSMAVMEELPKLAFETVCLTRANGWLRDLTADDSPYAAPGGLLGGFQPTETNDFGMPVLIRREFRGHEEALIRSFLDQPIVLYGHASDFKDGLGFLEDAARAVNRRPGVVWSDLSTLSRSCYVTRRDGDQLRVRSFARRIDLRIEPGIRSVMIDPPARTPAAPDNCITIQGNRRLRISDRSSTAVIVEPSDREVDVEIEFTATSRIQPHDVGRRPALRGAILRRVATEARDRAMPLRSRLTAIRTSRSVG